MVDVARDHPVHQFGGVAARDHVFVKRRDVDQRRRVPDGVVLVLVVRLVDADRVVARPLAIAQALAERESPFVYRSPYRQEAPPTQACWFEFTAAGL